MPVETVAVEVHSREHGVAKPWTEHIIHERNEVFGSRWHAWKFWSGTVGANGYLVVIISVCCVRRIVDEVRIPDADDDGVLLAAFLGVAFAEGFCGGLG